MTALLICPDTSLSQQIRHSCAAVDGFTIVLELSDYSTPVQLSDRIARRRAIETCPEQPPKGHFLDFSPVKGGSGASTIAANIAYQIHRVSMGRVLLADLNITAGMMPFLLQVTHPYSVLDALRHPG